jgi:hypothetical protein
VVPIWERGKKAKGSLKEGLVSPELHPSSPMDAGYLDLDTEYLDAGYFDALTP